MILDKRTTLADNVLVNTGAAGTYNIGDQYDTQLLASDTGNGADLYIAIDVGTAITGGTGQWAIVSDDQAPPLTNGTATVHLLTQALAAASLTAGRRILSAALPNGTYERYIGLQQITSVSALTAGTIKCFMTFDLNVYRAYVAGTTN